MLKGILYYKFENLTVQMGPVLRNWGQSLFRSGLAFQGASAHEDKIVPSLRCVPISASKYPKLLDVSFKHFDFSGWLDRAKRNSYWRR